MLQLFIGVLIGASAAYTANKKGYNPILWFFAGGGLLGIIAINVLPDTNKPEFTDEEKKKKQNTGNIVGGVIVAFLVILLIAVFAIR